jgi:hypothetical protein
MDAVMDGLGGPGKVLIVVGAVMLVLGGVLVALDRLGGAPGWLGRLPGDILIKRDHFTFYFPLATSLLISVVLSVLAWLLFRR